MGKTLVAKSRKGETWLAERSTDGTFEYERLLSHSSWSTVAPLVEKTGADPSVVVPRLARFAALVLDWNRTVSNLISSGDEARLVTRHIRESIEPAAWMVKCGKAAESSWIDLGSGAGVPALPIAMCGVGKEWLLVESRRPKVLFLRRALIELELQHIQVRHARLESLVDPNDAEWLQGKRFDAFTSRATMLMRPTLDLAAEVIRPGGAAYLWKGSNRETELEGRSEWTDWELDSSHQLTDAPIAVCRLLRKS